jgi:type IV fimbrial biogenesis protein FimT
MERQRHRDHSPDALTSGGFTLIELLVTLAVALILGVLSAEALPRVVQESRMVSEVNHFVTALHLGRSEAVLQGRRVVLCPSADQAHCGNSQDWPEGWLLFASDDREHDPDEPVLQAAARMGNGIGMRSGNSRKRIVFQPDGSAGGSNSSFTFCEAHQRARPRVICLSGTGRPRISGHRCDGTPIHCP